MAQIGIDSELLCIITSTRNGVILKTKIVLQSLYVLQQAQILFSYRYGG